MDPVLPLSRRRSGGFRREDQEGCELTGFLIPPLLTRSVPVGSIQVVERLSATKVDAILVGESRSKSGITEKSYKYLECRVNKDKALHVAACFVRLLVCRQHCSGCLRFFMLKKLCAQQPQGNHIENKGETTMHSPAQGGSLLNHGSTRTSCSRK